jgi:hypothetical protein
MRSFDPHFSGSVFAHARLAGQSDLPSVLEGKVQAWRDDRSEVRFDVS